MVVSSESGSVENPIYLMNQIEAAVELTKGLGELVLEQERDSNKEYGVLSRAGRRQDSLENSNLVQLIDSPSHGRRSTFDTRAYLHSTHTNSESYEGRLDRLLEIELGDEDDDGDRKEDPMVTLKRSNLSLNKSSNSVHRNPLRPSFDKGEKSKRQSFSRRQYSPPPTTSENDQTIVSEKRRRRKNFGGKGVSMVMDRDEVEVVGGCGKDEGAFSTDLNSLLPPHDKSLKFNESTASIQSNAASLGNYFRSEDAGTPSPPPPASRGLVTETSILIAKEKGRQKQNAARDRRQILLNRKCTSLKQKRIRDHLMITKTVRDEMRDKREIDVSSEKQKIRAQIFFSNHVDVHGIISRLLLTPSVALLCSASLCHEIKKMNAPFKLPLVHVKLAALHQCYIQKLGSKLSDGRRNRAAQKIINAWKSRGPAFRKWQFLVAICVRYKKVLMRPILSKRKLRSADLIRNSLLMIKRNEKIVSIKGEVNKRANMISKIIRDFCVCSKQRGVSLTWLLEKKIQSNGTTMRTGMGMGMGIPPAHPSKDTIVCKFIRAYINQQRKEHIARMNELFYNLKVDAEKKNLGLKTLDISDVRAFLLGGDESSNVNEVVIDVAKKRDRKWDGKWFLYSSALADNSFVTA